MPSNTSVRPDDQDEDAAGVAFGVVRGGLAEPGHVFLVDGLERLAVAQLRLFGRRLADGAQAVLELDVQRFLQPQRAVVVERGDALGGRHKVRPTRRGHFRDKVEDGALGGAVVP